MIDISFKIGDTLAPHGGEFQKNIFEHWQQIQRSTAYPIQRDFRPQKFAKYLSQIAVVSVNRKGEYADRLTGDTISEVLQLGPHKGRLVEPQDVNIRDVMHTMLNETILADAPMYYKGSFIPTDHRRIDFTALVLPFSYDAAAGQLDTMMLAFDFSKHNRQELDFTAFTADHP
ncbi:PAS domain-containing protein [Kordiimonas sp.]|uniref:PAS domain-containing protein n=1 Tax=Kordiimonas sp. TaxID=1970157 RepID=UPI003A9310A8